MLKLSLLNLSRRKSRTFLSLLGIIIGIGTLIALVSVVDGAYHQFNDMVSQLQGIIVMEKNSRNQILSKVDLSLKDKLENIQGVRTVVPEIWAMPTSIEGKSISIQDFTSTPPFIYSIDTVEYSKLRGNGWLGEMLKGNMLKSNSKKKAVIGAKIADDYDKYVGSKIRVNGESFLVEGILKNESSLMETIIVLSIDDTRDMISFQNGKVSSYYIELQNPKDDKKIAQLIDFKFGNEIDAMTSSDYSERLSSVLRKFRLVVFFVAMLASIVAAIGVINTMLMNVNERKREIGTLKASGWSSFAIIRMIIYETFFIGAIGAVFGVVFGFCLVYILKNFVGLNPLVSVQLIVQSIIFAIGLSLVAGIYPAYRAAKLDPVEAMTY